LTRLNNFLNSALSSFPSLLTSYWPKYLLTSNVKLGSYCITIYFISEGSKVPDLSKSKNKNAFSTRLSKWSLSANKSLYSFFSGCIDLSNWEFLLYWTDYSKLSVGNIVWASFSNFVL
jgi:hypothetical protein